MADAVAGLKLVQRMKRIVGDWSPAGLEPMRLSPGDVADLLAHVDRALCRMRELLHRPVWGRHFVKEASERGERAVAELRTKTTDAVLSREDVVGIVAYVFPLEIAGELTYE